MNIDILVKDNHSYHIAFLTKLLNINNKFNILNTNFYSSLNTIEDYTNYYNNIIIKVPDAKSFLSNNIDLFLKNFVKLSERNETNELININKCKSLKETEIEFLKIIEKKGFIPHGSHLFGIQKDGTKSFIKWTIEKFFCRVYNQKECEHHSSIHMTNANSIVVWLLELYLCSEGKKNKYNEVFTQYNKDNKDNKRIAVVMCGYVRNYEKVCASHKKLLSQANVDLFIHTWDDIGLKNNIRFKNNPESKKWLNDKSPSLDIDKLKSIYNPVKIKVENNKQILQDLSLLNKISPIFAYIGQARDDCSKYINSQLYSIYEGYKLVEEYENENEFKYSCIIKLRFDFLINHCSFSGIMSDIENYDAVWFPHAHLNRHSHAGGGGGCRLCDNHNSGKIITNNVSQIKKHTKHTNDICDIWFYGNRNNVRHAFELFLHGQSIMEKNHESNLQTYKTVNNIVDGEYIYIVNTADIENKIVCFYPERLLREHLCEIACKSSCNLQGGIVST